jgi:hypothetical protein
VTGCMIKAHKAQRAQNAKLQARIDELEGFALEALNRMNNVIFDASPKPEDLKELQDFVWAHQAYGCWKLDKLKLDPAYSRDWGGDG